MPNHVSNDLFIKGKLGVLACLAFIKNDTKYSDGGTLFDCDKVIPYPEKFRELDKLGQAWSDKADEWRKIPGNVGDKDKWAKFIKENPMVKDGFNSGGIEWCINNWGTKWGAYDVEILGDEPTDKKGALTFNSAWSPPTPVILALSKKFPELTFTLKFYEQGAGFKGVYSCKNGEVLKDEVDNSYRGRRGG